MSDRAARANPFRVSRVLKLRYRLEDTGWQELLERLQSLGHRGALVGPEGSGKTTLLEDLEHRLEARGWRIVRLRLNAERRHLTRPEWAALHRVDSGDLVTVDGVEQLPWWRWWRLERLCRGAGGLVVTTHRPGRLPCLHEHRTSPELLVDLVTSLVGRHEAEGLQPELERLFEAHHGNLRDCLRSLYDHWAKGTLASRTVEPIDEALHASQHVVAAVL
ncbi:MAG: hypothetical protein AAF657_07015 [Acidobacteriota bacterium]